MALGDRAEQILEVDIGRQDRLVEAVNLADLRMQFAELTEDAVASGEFGAAPGMKTRMLTGLELDVGQMEVVA